MDIIRIGLAQMNATVGAFDDNIKTITRLLREAERRGAQLVVFPELALCGYPPEDLILKPSFLQRCEEALHTLARNVNAVPVLIGFVERKAGAIYDSVAIIKDGEMCGLYRKSHLPNYGVFDEKRYFTPGERPLLLYADGIPMTVTICEDIWTADGPQRYAVERGGARMVLNSSASPYHRGKWREREELICNHARMLGVPVLYANMVGGQDDLVFDGHSLHVNERGEIKARGKEFQEDLVVVDIEFESRTSPSHGSLLIDDCAIKLPVVPHRPLPPPNNAVPSSEEEEEVYQALVLGTRDYVRKNGFSHVLIGLSGGIDSAIVASIAVDALGPDKVHALFMPSIYTSAESREDSEVVARNLGIDFRIIGIDDVFRSYLDVLEPAFQGLEEDVTEENIQARIRGNLLMAFSNKLGYLVLATGNKSEMACGYATLYGDMAGGFAVIKDVPKTLVFRLVDYRNRQAVGAWLPERLLSKAPSAELRHDQRDSDSLPPYETLDPILQAYVEEDLPLADIVEKGHDPSDVRLVIQLVDRSEYKRRQAPPGVKITPKAFGRDRRLPITNRFFEGETIPDALLSSF